MFTTSFRAVRAGFALALIAGSGGAQTTWWVDVTGAPPGTGTPGDPYTSIQYALSRPSTLNGDTLRVLPGTYVENVDFLGKAIRVASAGGPAATILDGGGASRRSRGVAGVHPIGQPLPQNCMPSAMYRLASWRSESRRPTSDSYIGLLRPNMYRET